MRVRLISRRPSDLELPNEHFEMTKWARRQEQLPAENADSKGRALVTPDDLRPGSSVVLEQIRDRDTERGCDWEDS